MNNTARPIRFCAGAIRYTIQIYIPTVCPSHKALLPLLLSVGRRKHANIMILRKPLFHPWTFTHHVSSFLHSGHSSQCSPRSWGSDINPESWSLTGTQLRCISHWEITRGTLWGIQIRKPVYANIDLHIDFSHLNNDAAGNDGFREGGIINLCEKKNSCLLQNINLIRMKRINAENHNKGHSLRQAAKSTEALKKNCLKTWTKGRQKKE